MPGKAVVVVVYLLRELAPRSGTAGWLTALQCGEGGFGRGQVSGEFGLALLCFDGGASSLGHHAGTHGRHLSVR